jgi:hypothetical protein
MPKLSLVRALFRLVGLISCILAVEAHSAEKSLVHQHLLDLDGMMQRRIVRVLVPYSKTIYFIDKGKQYGTAVEFGTALEKMPMP